MHAKQMVERDGESEMQAMHQHGVVHGVAASYATRTDLFRAKWGFDVSHYRIGFRRAPDIIGRTEHKRARITQMGRESDRDQWFKVTLPPAERGTKAAILQNDFETLYTINATPKDAALFATRGSEHSSFYFSPGAVAIARGLLGQILGRD
jgi:hypothetical protein